MCETFYQREINRIRSLCYSSRGQIEKVIGVRHFINSNFDKELNLDKLAGFHYISKFHLLRLFKKYYGQTPGEYLTDTRIEKSKEYLRIGSSVANTCYAVGFESPSSFTTLFKRKVGHTPTHYQKRQFSQSRICSD